MFRAKKIALFALPILLICAAVSARLLALARSDPLPIKLDPKILADYSGFYDFGNGYILTLRCEGDRLMSCSPNRYPREMLAETETNFFVKGEIPRFTFQRDNTGKVTQMLVQWKKGRETAQKLSALPPATLGTNGLIAATTGGKSIEAGMQILKEGGSAADA